MMLLTELLSELGYPVFIYSGKRNRLFRLIHMCLGVLKNLNSKYILIDTYSTFNFYYALIISQLARLFFIKYIPILHGGNLPIRLKENPILSKLIFKHAYVNVAPSKYLKNEFEQYNFRTILIPNPIKLENYKFKQRKTLQPKLLWVRTFDPIYNPEMAIMVLAALKKVFPNSSLSMIGPDKFGYLAKIKKLAEKLNVINNIEITGFLSKEEWILKSNDFDFFINTSNVDNTPVSVIESMALGLTVISTNVGGMPYLINNGVDGILVDKGDAITMASEISNLIKINNQTLALNARNKVEEFGLDIIKKQWLSILG